MEVAGIQDFHSLACLFSWSFSDMNKIKRKVHGIPIGFTTNSATFKKLFFVWKHGF